MHLFKHLSIALLILLPVSLLFDANSNLCANAAEEDTLDGEDGEVNGDGPDLTKSSEDENSDGLKSSPDVDIKLLFKKPVGDGLDLPVGKDVQFLVGFHNKGKKDLHVDTMDASFRYSQDFGYYLQNFTAFAYNKVVKPKQEVTLSYQFFVSDAYTPRPYGLSVNLYYRDLENNQFFSSVFNETVNIFEQDEGLDGETFFLFIVLGALVVLGIVGVYQLLGNFGKKHITLGGGGSKTKVETGTSNHDDVDYSWIPQETMKQLNKSPNPAKQSSPRQRRTKKD